MDLPKRKSIRLQGYDYSQNGSYFVTICTQNKICLFGEIRNQIMKLNANGLIVQTNIEKLNSLYDEIEVEQSVIMPNHVHMIIAICRERIACVPNNDPTKSQLPKILQVFKSSVTKGICSSGQERNAYNAQERNAYNAQERNAYNAQERNAYNAQERNAYNAFPTVWQSHYHDHIIRNEKDYQKIWAYIDENPIKWENDCFYIK